MGTYKINGVDTGSFGFVPESGRNTSNSFEQPNDPKTVFSHEWADEDGIEYDNVSPIARSARVFKLDGYLYADSEVDYNTNKSGLLDILSDPILTLFASEVNVTVNAKFKGFSTWQRMTQIKGSTKIVTKVTMEFNELMGTDLPVYDLYYGPADSIPVTAGDVTALTDAVYSTNVTMNTGTTYRFFSLAIQVGKSIVSVTDLDAGVFGDVTSQYTLRGTATISAHTYNIYSMEVAIPYSTSHRHKFILS